MTREQELELELLDCRVQLAQAQGMYLNLHHQDLVGELAAKRKLYADEDAKAKAEAEQPKS